MKTDNTVEGILQNVLNKETKIFRDDNDKLTKQGEKALERLLDILTQINETIGLKLIPVDEIENEINHIIELGY